jgi:dUTP pyrophosphatase
MEIKVKKLNENAILPRYATDGSGCFDLFSDSISKYTFSSGSKTCVFGTGLSFEIPKDHVMLVFSRSGQGFNHNVRLANCVGVIDSDYRGELKVKLTSDEINTLVIYPDDAIAQAMIVPIPKVSFVEVESLSETLRGEGGFGSTDKKEGE